MKRAPGALALAGALLVAPARGEGDEGSLPERLGAPPPVVQEIDVEERPGAPLPHDVLLRDAAGASVRLGELFDGRRPLLLVLAYYRCPMLCEQVLTGLVEGMRALDWELGRDYRAATISFDPDDGPVDAARKQRSALRALGREDAALAWSFFAADPEPIRRVTESLGFRYGYDARSRQFAHASVVFVLTPDGRISRYLYGVRFTPRDLRLALLEAGEGRVGTILERLWLTCYRYDPALRRYGPSLFGFLRVGALAVFLGVVVLLGWLWRREARQGRAEGP